MSYECNKLMKWKSDCDDLEYIDYFGKYQKDIKGILDGINFSNLTRSQLERIRFENKNIRDECKDCFKSDCTGYWSEWSECNDGKKQRGYIVSEREMYGGEPCIDINQSEERECGKDTNKKYIIIFFVFLTIFIFVGFIYALK